MTETLNSEVKEVSLDAQAICTESKEGTPAVVHTENSNLSQIKQSELPNSDTSVQENSSDVYRQLDPSSKTLDRVVWLILIGIIGVASLGGCVLSWLLATEGSRTFLWIGIASVVVALVGLFWLSRFIPEKTYASTSYRLQSHGLEIRRGIWWQHRIFIPTSRIQHTDVQQGPIERHFGLATLIVNTGGTHEPSIPLSGLRIDQAEQLRDQMSAQCEQRRVASSVGKEIS